MTNYVHFSLQLKDLATGKAIITAGGVACVTKNALPDKHTIYADAQATAASNPRALTRGKIDFWVLQSALVNGMVDLYIQCPGGHFVVARDITPSGPNEIVVDTGRALQQYVIPVAIADYPAAVETDTGFDCPAAHTGGRVLPDGLGGAFRVTAIDATETIDIGTATAESGDPDGFISALDVGTLGLVLDNGALLTTLAGHLCAGKSIVVTTTAGSDTVKGFAYLMIELTN